MSILKKCILRLLLLSMLLCLCPRAAADGVVTDTLSVKVGYWGMDVDRYVEVGCFHWSELEQSLPLHRHAYSFFRPDAEGEYRIAIDSACGFYLTDLLSYVDLYQDDVLSLQFYTRDQSVGYFTSFTCQDLFGTQRYYFEDLAAHIHPVCDEDGNVVSWDASEAWAECTQVPAMLALEDSWVWYDVGTEHTAPNYETMGTGNRFRLLFGQASPLETRTNQTAKYTHTVYVTLKGAPVLEAPQMLDASLGSHSVSVSMTVSNAAILQALSSLLEIQSSDESVLQITGIRFVPDAAHSDLVQIEISYEVLAQGEAFLSFSLGSEPVGSALPLSTGNGDPGGVLPGEPSEETSSDGGNPVQDEPSENGDSPAQTVPTAPAAEPASVSPASPTQPAGEPAAQPAEAPAEDPAQLAPEEPPEPQAEPSQPARRQALVLDAQTVERLLEPPQTQDAEAQPEAVVPLVLPAQRSDEALLLTACCAALLLLLGGGSALLYYNHEKS